MASPDTHPTAESTPAATVADGGSTEALRAAAGPGYAGEWALFCDYTAATDHPTLPTSVPALTGFFRALPCRPATAARRVRAIAAAHRHAGHLLTRPDTGPAAPRPTPTRRGPDPGLLIAGCPTRGWPTGLWGRRDAFLIVLTETLGHPHRGAREVSPAEISTPAGDSDDDALPRIRGRAVPTSDDPRTCPACAVVRWLEVLGLADGLGRGSARMHLAGAHAPTTASAHQHCPTEPARWRAAAVLLPAIDRHGWHDDYRPMTTRSIRSRLAAAARAQGSDPLGEPPDAASADPDSPVGNTATGPAQTGPDLNEVLGLLDDLADDADALNARIQALLDDEHPTRR
jgi:hypothetical protein